MFLSQATLFELHTHTNNQWRVVALSPPFVRPLCRRPPNHRDFGFNSFARTHIPWLPAVPFQPSWWCDACLPVEVNKTWRNKLVRKEKGGVLTRSVDLFYFHSSGVFGIWGKIHGLKTCFILRNIVWLWECTSSLLAGTPITDYHVIRSRILTILLMSANFNSSTPRTSGAFSAPVLLHFTFAISTPIPR